MALCCLRNYSHAHRRNLGYYMLVVKDGVGSRNRELHGAALKVMQGEHFDLPTAAEIAGIWTGKS